MLLEPKVVNVESEVYSGSELPDKVVVECTSRTQGHAHGDAVVKLVYGESRSKCYATAVYVVPSDGISCLLPIDACTI